MRISRQYFVQSCLVLSLSACGDQAAGLIEGLPKKGDGSGLSNGSGPSEAGLCSDTTHQTRSSCERASEANVWTPLLAAGERLVMDAGQDDERVAYDFRAALRQYSDPDRAQTFPDVDCGLSGSIETRVRNCNTLWSAALGAWSGASNWALVVQKNGRQVWRNERNGLLWSDVIAEAGHCPASGNRQDLGFDCSMNTQSLCAEAIGLVTEADDAKGGLMQNTATSVLWRLPSREDFLQAYADGGARMLPGFMTSNQWTSSVYSGDRSQGWIFFNTRSGNGGFYGANRGRLADVRCVGR